MTINGISAYSSDLFATSKSSAVSGYLQSASSSDSGIAGTQSTSQSKGAGRPPRMDESAQKAALAKLQETDPALANKMEEFHQKIDQMREDGASREDIQSAMKTNMDSLSETEKSELKSVFGRPPSGGPQGARGPGGPGGPGGARGPGGPGGPPPTDEEVSDVISLLQETDTDLATTLQGFQDAIDELEESGASDEEIQATRKQQMESLTDTQRDTLMEAFDSVRSESAGSSDSSSSSSNSDSSSAKAIYQQALSSYLKTQEAWSSATSQQALAFAA